ncbi:DUF4296 domain-containing protein [Puteibacter caeruleilacunae]|nr:DUF4296 domain-containing protein [Puteibacter caeruleilacunae]
MKLLRYLLVLLVIIGTFSCRQPVEAVKGDVISEEKMIEVLMDVHLAEAMYSSRYGMPKKKDLFESTELYKSVLLKHKISPEEFQESVYFYSRRMKDYDRIYQQVSDRFEAMKETLNEEQQEKIDIEAKDKKPEDIKKAPKAKTK